MNAIVSVTDDWGIGCQGHLLVRNPADMQFFRRTTMGGVVLCGRKTFESFPGGALEGRRNIVITRNEAFRPTDAEVAHSVQEALALVSHEDPNRVWLIGGAAVYEQLLPHCAYALVTRHRVVLEADSFFPDLDASDQWELVRSSDVETTPSGIPFAFTEYRRT